MFNLRKTLVLVVSVIAFTVSSYGYPQYVAVGDNTILSSPDGDTWTYRQTDTAAYFYGVTYGKGLFVAVGQRKSDYSGAIVSSPDGVTWSDRSPGTGRLYAITYGGGQFVAVGTHIILRSTDGIYWSPVSLRNIDYTVLLRAVVYADSQYVAVGFSNVVLTSPDAITWTMKSGNPPPSGPDSTFSYTSITYGNDYVRNIYVATANDGYGKGYVCTSTDAAVWSRQRVSDKGLSAVTYVDATMSGAYGVFVIIGQEVAFKSNQTHPLTWFECSTGSTCAGLVYGYNKFVAVGSMTTIMTSPSGCPWTGKSQNAILPSPAQQNTWLNAVTYANIQNISVRYDRINPYVKRGETRAAHTVVHDAKGRLVHAGNISHGIYLTQHSTRVLPTLLVH